MKSPKSVAGIRQHLFKKIPLVLGFLAIAGLAEGCKPHHSAGDSESYIENGKVWAYGSVQLTGISGLTKILIKRNTTVEGLDGGVPVQGRVAQYTLLGTVDDAEMKEMAYVDYHPSMERTLAFHYGIEFVHRNQNTVDLWGILRKAGRSYYKRQKVYLGQAQIAPGADTGTVRLADGLKVSSIASGVFTGQWAFHYPDIKHVIIRPWSGMCTQSVTQRPGQAPGQNPGQFDTCRPIPKEHDLCGGDPTKAGCRPARHIVQSPVTQTPVTPVPADQPVVIDEPAKIVTGLEVISSEEQVFSLHDDVRTAKIVFVSEKRDVAGPEENAAACADSFMAVGRTVNRQINDSCVLKPAPAESENGKLTCAVTVTFEHASTYLENVCNITAVFRGSAPETQGIQVLRKQ